MKQKEKTEVITPKAPTTVDVESEPVVTGSIEYNWELNKSQACMRRMMKLKLSDKEVSQMLLDPKKRQQFGHMYLKSIKVEIWNRMQSTWSLLVSCFLVW